MRQGFGFILARPAMKPLIVLSFMITLLGFQLIAFLPVFAREAFQADARVREQRGFGRPGAHELAAERRRR